MNVAYAVPILLAVIVLAFMWDALWNSDDEAEAAAPADRTRERATPDARRPGDRWLVRMCLTICLTIGGLAIVAAMELGPTFLLNHALGGDTTPGLCLDASQLRDVTAAQATAGPAPVGDPRSAALGREILRRLRENCPGP